MPDKLPRDQIKIADWQWNGGYSSGLARATFTLHNTTDFAVRDIRVQCVYYGRSGSEINRHDKVIYDHIAPGKKLKTKEIVFGFINEQAVRSDCEVMAHHPTF